jgi:hypothetical protein
MHHSEIQALHTYSGEPHTLSKTRKNKNWKGKNKIIFLYMIHIENPKYSIEKSLELMDGFSQYNIQQSIRICTLAINNLKF